MLKTYFKRERTRTRMPLVLLGHISMTLVSGWRSAGSLRERSVGVFLGQHSLPLGLRPLESLSRAWMPPALRSFAVISLSMANCAMHQGMAPPAAWVRITSSPS